MGTGYTRNDTSNNIADGNVINASDLDGEFDAVEAAFNASTGHTHDGTAAEGGPITVLGPAQEWVADGTALYPKTDNTYDLGKASNEIKDLYVDGTANIDSLVADTADINGGTIDAAVIGGTTPAAGTFTDVTASGTISFSGATVSIDGGTITGITDLSVADGGTGASTSSEARTNLGLGTISTQDSTSVNIDGGAIDGTVIGGSSPAAGSFTTISGSSTASFGGAVTVSASDARIILTDTDTNTDAIISTDNAGNLRLRADANAEAAASYATIEVDGTTYFKIDPDNDWINLDGLRVELEQDYPRLDFVSLGGTSTHNRLAFTAGDAGTGYFWGVEAKANDGTTVDYGLLANWDATGFSSWKLRVDNVEVFFADRTNTQLKDATGVVRVNITDGGNLDLEDNGGTVRFSLVQANDDVVIYENDGTTAAIRWDQSAGYVMVPTAYSTTTAGAANVHVLSNGGLWRSTSTGKFKEERKPVKDAVKEAPNHHQDTGDVIDSLMPVSFKSTHEADHGRRFTGFIAEEVIEAFPEAAADSEDNYDVRALVAVLWDEVQTLRKRVAALEAKN